MSIVPISTQEELAIHNTLSVTFAAEDGLSKDRYYPLQTLNLTINSTDAQIFNALNAVLREECDVELPRRSFVVARFAETNNIQAYPKTELGGGQRA